MPEYSSTTITPSDGVQLPGMNGNTSGNLVLSALRDFILASKGQANGLASLDANGKLPSSQLPDLADDVIVVASYATLPATGTAGKIYITADNNKMYRWDPDLETPNYVELSVDLSAYATKAELAEEESAREAADSNLKDAIRKDEARITNLEEKADPTGAYKTVNYRGTNAVPTGKAKYGLVESIVGKSRAWNQLFNVANSPTTTSQGITRSVDTTTGILTWSGLTESATYLAFGTIDLISGHIYLINFDVTDSGTNPLTMNAVGFSTNPTFGASHKTDILTANSNGSQRLRYNFSAGQSINSTVRIIVRDLTLIFPEGVPATVAECVQKCPDLLKYDAYGTSIVDTTVEGVRSTSINIWDEEWALGYWNWQNNGQFVANNNFFASKNKFPVSPSTTYYWLSPSVIREVLFYDASGDYVSRQSYSTIAGTTFTTPPNCYYIAFYYSSEYGNTYANNIQFCLNSDAEKEIYHPHILDTLTLPSSVTLRSAGSVAEVYDLETGKVSHPIGSYTFTGSETWVSYASGYQSICLPKNAKSIAGSAAPEMITDIALDVTSRNVIANGTAGISVHEGSVFISDTSFATSGKTINYVLATPDPDTDEGIVIDNTIKTESGGTINTIQTQTPVIDNCLDVGYLAL